MGVCSARQGLSGLPYGFRRDITIRAECDDPGIVHKYKIKHGYQKFRLGHSRAEVRFRTARCAHENIQQIGASDQPIQRSERQRLCSMRIRVQVA